MYKITVWVVVPLIIVAMFVAGWRGLQHSERTINVIGTERVCSPLADGGTKCKYLVYAEEGTFENVDNLFRGKFRSSDLQGQFKKGGCFHVETVGFRNGFLSTYPNIIKVTPCRG